MRWDRSLSDHADCSKGIIFHLPASAVRLHTRTRPSRKPVCVCVCVREREREREREGGREREREREGGMGATTQKRLYHLGIPSERKIRPQSAPLSDRHEGRRPAEIQKHIYIYTPTHTQLEKEPPQPGTQHTGSNKFCSQREHTDAWYSIQWTPPRETLCSWSRVHLHWRCVRVCTCVNVCEFVYVGMYVCVFVCVYVCVYVCTYVRMYVCTYVKRTQMWAKNACANVHPSSSFHTHLFQHSYRQQSHAHPLRVPV